MHELMWWDKVPLHVEDKLRDAGAVVSNSWMPGMSNVVVDRELITGQGPTSAGKLATAFANALEHGVAAY
jgi:putative intracellular protease/amidase